MRWLLCLLFLALGGAAARADATFNTFVCTTMAATHCWTWDTNATDSGSSPQNGTVSGSISFGQSMGAGIHVSGILPGTTTSVVNVTGLVLTAATFTIATSVNTTGTTAAHLVYPTAGTSAAGGIGIYYNVNGVCSKGLAVEVNNGASTYFCGPTTINDGTWHSIVFSCSGSVGYCWLFVDGAFQTAAAFVPTAPSVTYGFGNKVSGPGPVTNGAAGAVSYYSGVAWSLAQAQAYDACGRTGSCAAPSSACGAPPYPFFLLPKFWCDPFDSYTSSPPPPGSLVALPSPWFNTNGSSATNNTQAMTVYEYSSPNAGSIGTGGNFSFAMRALGATLGRGQCLAANFQAFLGTSTDGGGVFGFYTTALSGNGQMYLRFNTSVNDPLPPAGMSDLRMLDAMGTQRGRINISSNVYHLISLVGKLSDNSDGFETVYVDGVQAMTYSGPTTDHLVANYTINNFFLQGGVASASPAAEGLIDNLVTYGGTCIVGGAHLVQTD